jgi:hypothetical protein
LRSEQTAITPRQAPEDISELADLRQLVETLQQSVRARDDFIVIAAHELRNPMTPIVGVAELALIAARKDGTCPPRVIRLLERLQRLSLIWQSVMWRPGKVWFLIGVKNPLPIGRPRTPENTAPWSGYDVAPAPLCLFRPAYRSPQCGSR